MDIKQYIGMILFLCIATATMLGMIIIAIVETYKMHSDNYAYDFDKQKYVRIKKNDK